MARRPPWFSVVIAVLWLAMVTTCAAQEPFDAASLKTIAAVDVVELATHDYRTALEVTSLRPGVRTMAAARVRELAAGIAAAHDAEIAVEIRDVFSVVECAPQVAAVAEVASELRGAESVDTEAAPLMGSEDFADMSMRVPGAFFLVGGRPGPGLHNPGYDFDDTIIPIGSALLARMVERRTAA